MPDLWVDETVVDGQQAERQQVQEDQVHPADVDLGVQEDQVHPADVDLWVQEDQLHPADVDRRVQEDQVQYIQLK